jgi:serine/threonine protein kinase
MAEQNPAQERKLIIPYEIFEQKKLIFPEGSASKEELYRELKDNACTLETLKKKSGDMRYSFSIYSRLIGHTLPGTDLIVTGINNVGGIGILYSASLRPVACAALKHTHTKKEDIQKDFETMPLEEFSERYMVNFSDTLYLAKCLLLSKKPQYSGTLEYEQRFEREGQVMSEINNPFIPKVIFADKNVIALKYIPYTIPIESLKYNERTLEERLVLGENAVGIFAGINKIRTEEGKPVLDHRDITGSNILVMRPDIPDLAAYAVDFGLVSDPDKPLPEANEESKNITGGLLVGTPSYIPPEVAASGVLKEYKSDVYSFGVLLYMLMTGTLPFRGDNRNEILSNIITWNGLRGPVPPHLLDDRIPMPLSSLIMKAISRKPEDRYHSVIEFYEAIKTVRNSSVFPRSEQIGVRSDEAMSGLPTLVISEHERIKHEFQQAKSRRMRSIRRQAKEELIREGAVQGRDSLISKTLEIGATRPDDFYEAETSELDLPYVAKPEETEPAPQQIIVSPFQQKPSVNDPESIWGKKRAPIPQPPEKDGEDKK